MRAVAEGTHSGEVSSLSENGSPNDRRPPRVRVASATRSCHDTGWSVVLLGSVVVSALAWWVGLHSIGNGEEDAACRRGTTHSINVHAVRRGRKERV